MIGEIYKETPISLYQPTSADIQELTKNAKLQYGRANEILTSSWPELNDMSIIDRTNRDKKTFNAFVDENVDDPKEAWKWRGTRSSARNRALGMYAQLTAGFMFPMVSAQDENSDEDRGVGDFMRDMLLWMGENSTYKSSFLQLVMGILTNPVTYLGAEYVEVFQKIREKADKGYTTKEVLDEELSGFQAPVYGPRDVLITNAYQQNIQRQTCVIKERYLDYSDAQKKYSKEENWQYVQAGQNSVFNETNGLFYDVMDMENPDLVKETILMWRGEDTEVPFLGGVYMGNDNTEHNPMKHRDNFGLPKYDVIPFGFHKISEHFFFYKSLMNSLFWDDQLIDAMYENVMNNEFINQNLPVIVSGDDQIDTSVTFPGAVHVSAKENVKVQTAIPPQRSDGYRALELIENSIKEASISDTSMGQLPEASQKAYSVAKADQQAKIMLKGVGQSIGESIVQYGKLMIDIAIRHYSIPQVEEIAGINNVKYRQFVLPSMSKGKKVSKVLRYDKNLIGKKMSKKEQDKYNLKLYEEAGEDKVITTVNPEIASRMKYLVRIDVEEMFAENKEYTQRLLSQLYAQLRQDPLIDAETLVRKMMYSFFRTEGDELLADKNVIEAMKEQTMVPQGELSKEMPMDETSKLRSMAMI